MQNGRSRTRSTEHRKRPVECSSECGGPFPISLTGSNNTSEGDVERVARSALCRMAGHCDYAAHVDADRGQNSSHAESVDESLMACDALRNLARPNDLSDSARHIDIRNSFRFHRSRVAHSQERRCGASVETAAAVGGEILWRSNECASRHGIACEHY